MTPLAVIKISIFLLAFVVEQTGLNLTWSETPKKCFLATKTVCYVCCCLFQAVFKNYDNDRDGFISHAEFEAIAGNFPFIDSFCVLDADQ